MPVAKRDASSQKQHTAGPPPHISVPPYRIRSGKHQRQCMMRAGPIEPLGNVAEIVRWIHEYRSVPWRDQTVIIQRQMPIGRIPRAMSCRAWIKIKMPQLGQQLTRGKEFRLSAFAVRAGHTPGSAFCFRFYGMLSVDVRQTGSGWVSWFG